MQARTVRNIIAWAASRPWRKILVHPCRVVVRQQVAVSLRFLSLGSECLGLSPRVQVFPTAAMQGPGQAQFAIANGGVSCAITSNVFGVAFPFSSCLLSITARVGWGIAERISIVISCSQGCEHQFSRGKWSIQPVTYLCWFASISSRISTSLRKIPSSGPVGREKTRWSLSFISMVHAASFSPVTSLAQAHSRWRKAVTDTSSLPPQTPMCTISSSIQVSQYKPALYDWSLAIFPSSVSLGVFISKEFKRI